MNLNGDESNGYTGFVSRTEIEKLAASYSLNSHRKENDFQLQLILSFWQIILIIEVWTSGPCCNCIPSERKMKRNGSWGLPRQKRVLSFSKKIERNKDDSYWSLIPLSHATDDKDFSKKKRKDERKKMLMMKINRMKRK